MNDEIDKLEGKIVNDIIALEEKIVNDVMKTEKRITTLEKVFLKENERLESKIKDLENELDEMYKMIEQTMPIRKAVLEIEDYLQKKQNGFDAHYLPILTYSRK